MPELSGSWSHRGWSLYRVSGGVREMYLLMSDNASLAHIALSVEELERLADFLDRIVAETEDMTEEQVIADRDQVECPPFLVARSYNELGWLIEFYTAPDYAETVPVKTLSLSNVKIREWSDAGFLRR